MSLLQRPRKTAQDFPKDFQEETSEFAGHFHLLADLMEKADLEGDGEDFALYTSTCRNAYLTINGMFVDIREILGHMWPPDGLFGALQHGRASNFGAMKVCLDKICLASDAFDQKKKCWERRIELRNLLNALLDQYGYLDQEAIKKVLYEVVDQDENCELTSVQQFLSFESSENNEQRLLLQKLFEAKKKLKPALDCSSLIRKLGEELKQAIFTSSSNDMQSALWPLTPVWKTLSIEFHAWISSDLEDGDKRLVHEALRQIEQSSSATVLIESHDKKTILEFLTSFNGFLQNAIGEVYADIAKAFRPNVGKRPLPSTFEIDLSVPLPSKPDGQFSVVASPRPYSESPLEKIKVAIAQPPIGSSEISENTARYHNNEKRRIIEEWACLAIETAAADAQLIVFPELFIPEDAIAAVRAKAKSANIGVVCGVEGIWREKQYSCQASITIPGLSHEHRQYKNYRSNLEPENFQTKGGQLCFFGSKLGSFSVVLCSDFREFDVMAAIEEQRFLDYLIVCSCNPEPYPKLWKYLAIADAARLHCFVIIANWSKERDANGFGMGSACISPTRKIECLEDKPRIQKLALPSPNDAIEGSLLFHELDLAALFRDREKPKDGFLSPPHRRRDINKKAGY